MDPMFLAPFAIGWAVATAGAGLVISIVYVTEQALLNGSRSNKATTLLVWVIALAALLLFIIY